MKKLVPMNDMLADAEERGYAVGAFNITNLIQLEAVVEAAVDKRAPLIIQTSVTPSKFLGKQVHPSAFHELHRLIWATECRLVFSDSYLVLDARDRA